MRRSESHSTITDPLASENAEIGEECKEKKVAHSEEEEEQQ
jgi:hypothetical protein